jgi:hypothetical protein
MIANPILAAADRKHRPKFVSLIREMSIANPLWDTPRSCPSSASMSGSVAMLAKTVDPAVVPDVGTIAAVNAKIDVIDVR